MAEFNWRETETGKIAERIAEVAPIFYDVKRPEDVAPRHITAMTYALGIEVEFRLYRPRTNEEESDG